MEELTCQELYAQLEPEYNEYVKECACGMSIMAAKLENLKNTEPIFEEIVIERRLKSFTSAIDKARKNGYQSLAEVKENIKDIAGIRVITMYRDRVFDIVAAIDIMPGIFVITKKDYINNPKPNGYTGFHLLVVVEEVIRGEAKKIPVEIQIRTHGMDLWARAEHNTNYKSDNPSSDMAEFFLKMKEFIDGFDASVIAARDQYLNT